MNNSYHEVNIDRHTIAGEVCLFLSRTLGIQEDAECSLFSYTHGAYTVMQDDDVVLKKVNTWNMSDAEDGLSRLVYKLRIFIPDGNMDTEAKSAESPDNGAHRLLFIDAVHRTITGLYSVSLEKAALLAGLQLQSAIGDYNAETHESSYILSSGIENYVAPALLERFENVEDVEQLIQGQHESLAGMPRLAAEQQYLEELKAEVQCYGASFYACNVMIQETDDDEDERTEAFSAIVAVSMNGIYLLSGWNWTEQEYFNYETITKWTVAANPDLFAFSIHDRIIYFCLSSQPEDIENCVQMHIAEIINSRRGTVVPSRRDENELKSIKSRMFGKSRSNIVTQQSPKVEDGVQAQTPKPTPPAQDLPINTNARSSDSSLPEGWEAVPDRKTGKTYYWNESTGRTSWKHPAAINSKDKSAAKPEKGRRRFTKRRASALMNLSRRRASVGMALSVSNGAAEKKESATQGEIAETATEDIQEHPDAIPKKADLSESEPGNPEEENADKDSTLPAAPSAPATAPSEPEKAKAVQASEPEEAPAEQDGLASWMTANRLSKYNEAFHDLGVESIEDLHEVMEDDLESLGMKKLEIRRFKAAVAKLS